MNAIANQKNNTLFNRSNINVMFKAVAIICGIALFNTIAQSNCVLSQNKYQSKCTVYYSSYKPYTRWWWFASNIDTVDVKDQLNWLKAHEFGGVEIAWIYPMGGDSTVQHPAFLSDEWSKSVAYAKKYADKIGMGCDFTFGTLWPFCDVNLHTGDQTRNYFDSVEIAKRTITWDHPKVAKILNHLDKSAFKRYAYRMNKGLSDAYKGSTSGVFVDSWEVETQYLWTRGFGDKFKEINGYDIEPYMRDKTLLNHNNADVFYDYMKVLSDYVLNDFYIPYSQNATAVGAFSRAQCGGAPTDLLTAFSVVDVPETEAILYEPSFGRIPASAAALMNKSVVTSETFTCAYGWTSWSNKHGRGQSPYQGKEQIADLKLICDALFANGVNQIIWHGFPYNQLGDTTNYFYTTCEISMDSCHNLSGKQLSDFNAYMEKVSKYMRKGKTYSDMAVYIPLEDSWMGMEYPDSLQMPWSWGKYELRYIKTPAEFKGFQPLWINEHFLNDASYSHGKLHCGNMNFKVLYIDVQYMELNSIKTLIKLASEGLPIYLKRDPIQPGKNKDSNYSKLLSQLKSFHNVSSNVNIIYQKPLIDGENLPDFWVRQDNDDYYVFFANPMSQSIKYPLQYCYAFTDNGCQREIVVNHDGKSEHIVLNFNPRESLLMKITKQNITFIKLNYCAKK